jgi:hypothetical protein
MSRIIFVPQLPGLAEIDEIKPKPTSSFIPDWWKKAPYEEGSNSLKSYFQGNIKSCPSFIDYFRLGYIVPAWCDVVLGYDKETKKWGARPTHPSFKFAALENSLTIDTIPYEYQNSKALCTFKSISPWYVITEPGYSCLVLPLFFEFNKDFSIIPGIVDTDIHHRVNLDITYHSDEKEIWIKRGQPLFHILPFKREKNSLEIIEGYDLDNKTFKRLTKHDAEVETQFRGNKAYVNLRKKNNLKF